MEKTYIEDKTFEKTDFSESNPVKGEYDNCTFNHCNFSGADLSHITFSECRFHNCNLSMAKTVKTALKEVAFTDCKLLGIHFEQCSQFLFSVYFENSVLNLSSFFGMNLKKARFKICSLQEVDFTQADLSGAIFDQCNLERAVFAGSILEGSDFRTAYHFSIDPEINRMKKARFSTMGIAGLLDKYDLQID